MPTELGGIMIMILINKLKENQILNNKVAAKGNVAVAFQY